MSSSPAHKRRASEVDASHIVGTLPDMSGQSTNMSGASSSSPYNMNVGPSASTPHSFNIDTFDFGADFSLPSSLDELSIFHNGTGSATSATTQPSGGSTSSSHVHQTPNQASPANANFTPGSNSSNSRIHGINATGSVGAASSGSIHNNGSGGGGGAPSSNNSVAGSPRSLHFSPRTTMREQVLQASRSRNQSPHSMISLNSNEGGMANGMSSSASTIVPNTASTNGNVAANGSNGLTVSASELQNLLQAINASNVSQQQTQQQIQGGNLSIGELEKLLAEKEQMERMQSVQTAFLRQQIDALQRQGSSVSSHLSQLVNNSGANGNHASGGDGSSTALSAAHLMQQFQQLSSQQALNNGNAAGMPFSQPYSLPGAGNSAFVQPKFGLITPVSTDAFAPKHQLQPFVSPLTIPGGSQAQMMDASRALESPAITPLSVFSNVGSSSTSTELFSPLTSPLLNPQQHGSDPMGIQMSPFHGPIKGRPKGRGGIPNAPTAKSVPRKNRSTTAEARANRARASPLVKPTVPSASTMTQQTRKRNESFNGSISNGLPSPLGPNVPIMSRGGSRNGSRRASQDDGDGKQTPTAFPPLLAGSEGTKPMDASPSEAAASTPSPIDDMPPPRGKPLTPSSLMGMRNDKSNGKTAQGGKGGVPTLSRSSSTSAKPGKVVIDKQVTFAPQSPGVNGLQSILPGGPPSQDRDSWTGSTKVAGVGNGVGSTNNGNVGGGGGGLESRRTSHKAAEQKRRDSLKFCFDELRGMLPAITLDDDVPGGSMLGPDGLLEDQDAEGFAIEEVGDGESAKIANRAISKVALLRHSNEYLIRLKHRIGRRERDLAMCRREIMELRSRLGLPVPPELPTLAVVQAGSAAAMGHDMSGVFNLDTMAEQMHPHQAAILTSAIRQRYQQVEQQQPHMDFGSMGEYAHTMHSASMDTSS